MKKSILLLTVLFIALCACRERPEVDSQPAVEHTQDAKARVEPVATTEKVSDSTFVTDKDSIVAAPAAVKEQLKVEKKEVAKSQESKAPELVLNREKTTILVGSLCAFFLLLIYIVYRILNIKYKRLKYTIVPLNYDQKISNLERSVKTLQNQLTSLQNTRTNIPQPIQPEFNNSSVFTEHTKSQVLESSMLYFSAPRRFDNGAAGFDTSRAKSSFVPSESKYRLTPNADCTTARFDLVADNFADMINIPQDFVDPICRAEGQSTTNTRRVVCLQPGQARLMDRNWIVIEKMIVRYE